MDKLLENVHVYSDILRKCSTPEVANWKVEDLQRALSWMNHFVKVHGHIASRQSVVQKFDIQLRKLGIRFGGKELNLEFLNHSSDYLLKALLENPVLPSELREKILNEHASVVLLKHLEDFSSNMSLLSSLTSMHEKLMELQPSPCRRTTQSTDTSGLLLVDATCLRDDIAWQLKYSPDQRLNSSVQKRLVDITHENGMEVILLVLTHMLEKKNEAAQGSELPQQPKQCDPVQRAVLDWLLQQIGPPSSAHSASQQEETMHTIACKLWSQDPKLLAQVSSKHLDFFKAHIQHLVQQLQKLEMVETSSHDIDESGDTLLEQEFEVTVSHFQELLAAGDHLKEICVSLIKSRVTTLIDKTVWSKLHLRLVS